MSAVSSMFVVGVILATLGGPAPPARLPAPRAPSEPDATGVSTDVLAASPEPTTAEGLALRPEADGTLRYDDPHGRFTAVVHADGRVEFRDRFLGEIGIGVSVRGQFSQGLDFIGLLSNLFGATKRHNPYEQLGLVPGAVDLTDRFARVEYGMEKAPPSPFRYGPITWQLTNYGRMGGLSDLLLGRGQRRYTAAKRAFLEQTASLRARMATEVERSRRRAVFMASREELSALWDDEGLPIAVRRQRLFEWWDDCDEAPSPGFELDVDAARILDAERARDAERMRRQIEAFVRRVAPASSPDAYSATELRRLNARRRSQQRFAPYTTPGEPVPGDDEV